MLTNSRTTGINAVQRALLFYTQEDWVLEGFVPDRAHAPSPSTV